MSDHKIVKPLWSQEDTMNERKSTFLSTDEMQPALSKPSLLLHSCCGPCSAAVIPQVAMDFQVTIYFYNPNITDEEEYNKRKASQIALIDAMNDDSDRQYIIDYKEGPYNRQHFFEVAADWSNEPEGGRRCIECFRLRLEQTAKTALELGYDFFGTTLAVSPHKDYDGISHIGRRLSQTFGISYLDRNFKKNGGFQQSIALSKKYGLYRQNYCGCQYSNQNNKQK